MINVVSCNKEMHIIQYPTNIPLIYVHDVHVCGCICMAMHFFCAEGGWGRPDHNAVEKWNKAKQQWRETPPSSSLLVTNLSDMNCTTTGRSFLTQTRAASRFTHWLCCVWGPASLCPLGSLQGRKTVDGISVVTWTDAQWGRLAHGDQQREGGSLSESVSSFAAWTRCENAAA